MTEDGRGFGRRLVSGRQLTGLSQEELAERAGLPVRTLRNLERGRVSWPHPDTVRRLADALGVHGEARTEFTAAAGRLLGRGASATEAAAASRTPGPRQLPPAVRNFTGRNAELDFLTSLLDAPGAPDDGGTVVISAIGGTAGVGKTALAVHWAHQAAGRFCDGQLHANLRGFDPSGIPTRTRSARSSPAPMIKAFRYQMPAW